MKRRSFLGAAAATLSSAALANCSALAQSERKRVKITDVKVMLVRGLDINSDHVKANLAPGETWWGG